MEQIVVRNIYCIGRNYAEHAAELGNQLAEQPLVFLKSTASLRQPGPSRMAFAEETFHHEAELVLVIGDDCELGKGPGISAVAGVGLGLDLTRREVQTELKKKGQPWTLAKSFAGSAVVGKFLAVDGLQRADYFRFQLRVNGDLRQEGDTRDMLFSIPSIIDYLNSFQALQRGDLIYTGTPAGVGPIRKGDHFNLTLLGENLALQGTL